MKSANRSLFVAIGLACGLVLGGNVGCNVSADGLGTAMEPSDDGPGTGGITAGAGGSLGEGGDMQPGTGGVVGTGGVAGMGAGGMRMGGMNAGGAGAGGMNAGGARTGGMNAGGAGTGGMIAAGGAAGMNMGGAAGINMGGAAGMNTGGAAGINMGGTAGTNMGGTAGMNMGPIHDVPATPGKVACGSNSCDSDEYCCYANGEPKCIDSNKDCGGSYSHCDDQKDCKPFQVCCGSALQNSFNTLCVSANQCTAPEAVLCANSNQCGDGRRCCARSAGQLTFGICLTSCPAP